MNRLFNIHNPDVFVSNARLSCEVQDHTAALGVYLFLFGFC